MSHLASAKALIAAALSIRPFGPKAVYLLERMFSNASGVWFFQASQPCFSVAIKASLVGAAATGFVELTLAFAVFAVLTATFVAGGWHAVKANAAAAAITKGFRLNIRKVS